MRCSHQARDEIHQPTDQPILYWTTPGNESTTLSHQPNNQPIKKNTGLASSEHHSQWVASPPNIPFTNWQVDTGQAQLPFHQQSSDMFSSEHLLSSSSFVNMPLPHIHPYVLAVCLRSRLTRETLIWSCIMIIIWHLFIAALFLGNTWVQLVLLGIILRW